MKEIRFTPIRNIYWDNHGQPALVFVKGKKYKGELHKSGKITAATPYYDVDDYINESDIELID